MHAREALLLTSKLSVPPWRPDWIQRPRLLALAARAAGARLLLCAAPAGFGKTTALLAWAEQRRAESTLLAWYALDPSDNDPSRFVAYLLAAFARADPQLPLATLQQRAGADIEQALIGLLNLLEAAERRYALILDDYHLIQAPAVQQLLSMLLERLPEQVQLAIGTRADPPLPLARLRARGLLAEIRAADLQFDADEIKAFFRQSAQISLSAAALELLHNWTEGWAAGLQLVALALPRSLADSSEIEQLHTHFAGSQRHIFHFLADEVFAQQPAPIQTFLLNTSVLDHLTPELCDALLHEPGAANGELPASAQLLEYLEQMNLFLVRLDGVRPWYRYHHLFSSFLQQRLETHHPGRRASLHLRAAGWYAAAGEIVPAVTHALAAANPGYAAELVMRVAWPQLSARGEIITFLGWAGQFSDQQLRQEPALCLQFGRAAYLTQQWTLAEHCFALAEQGLQQSPAQESVQHNLRAALLVNRAALATQAGELAHALQQLSEAEPALWPGDAGALASHASARGVCHFLRGELQAAYAAFELMEQQAWRHNHTYLAADALQYLALLDITVGQLACAERRCNELLARFVGELPAIPSLALALTRLATVAYQRGQLARAEVYLQQAAQLSRRSLGYLDQQIWYWLVLNSAARQDRLALRTLLAGDEGRSEARVGIVLASITMSARGEGLLALGAAEEAWEWVQRAEQLPGQHRRELQTISLVRVLLARQQAQLAEPRLQQLISSTEAGGQTGYLIEALALLARALAELRREPEALQALGRALKLAQPAGYRQVFTGNGPVISRLLRMLHETDATLHNYCAQLLAGVSNNQHPLLNPHAPAILAEALTERELDVLQLLAGGATNQDIAGTLVVSVGTVKTHLNHILGKLEARNRTEAVARARALGLLS